MASCLQMLERDYKDKLGADADQLIRYAVESAVRMKALILDLLTYSRVATKVRAPEQISCQLILDRESEKPASRHIRDRGGDY